MLKMYTNQPTKAKLRKRSGFLGIDIGTSSIKMARMECAAGRWTVVNRILLPLNSVEREWQSAVCDGFLADQLSIFKTRTLSSRHDCSCVLPRSVTDIRTVNVPDGSKNDVQQMATESFRDCFPEDFDDRVTQLWQHSASAGDMATVSCVSVRDKIATIVVRDLESVGLRCVGMQGHPFVLAQASQLSRTCHCDGPVGLLDWGHSAATLVVARDGRPEFTRTFRDCGAENALRLVSSGLSISPSDTLHVLASSGLPSPLDQAGESVISKAVDRLLTPEINRVADELQKTMLYLRHHIQALIPQRLILFGGMATIPNIATVFQHRSGLETTPWTLDTDDSHASDPLYAAALAASTGGSSL